MLNKLKPLVYDKRSRNFVIYGIGQAFNLLSPFLVAPYIIHICGQDGFGKTQVGFSLALFLILIVDYSFDIKGVKEVSESRDDHRKQNELFNKIYKAKAVLLVLALCTGVILINTLSILSSEATVMYLSLPIVAGQFLSPVWFLQGNEDFKTITIITICSKILYVIAVFLLIKLPGDYVFINLCLGTTAIICNLSSFYFVFRKYKLYAVNIQRNVVFELLKKDSSFCLSQLFVSARQLTPTILVSYFLGYYQVGQYKIIEQIVMLFRTFLQVFYRFFYPEMCYRIATAFRKGFSFWKFYVATAFGIVLLGSATIFVLAPFILRYFNLNAADVSNTVGLLRAGTVIPLLMVFSMGLEQLIFGLGNNKFYMRVVFAVTVANLIVSLIFIKFWQIRGIISALTIAESIFILAYFSSVRNNLKKTVL